MIRHTILVSNRLGLHARAAAKLVRLASRFSSDIFLSRADANQQIDRLCDGAVGRGRRGLAADLRQARLQGSKSPKRLKFVNKAEFPSLLPLPERGIKSQVLHPVDDKLDPDTYEEEAHYA